MLPTNISFPGLTEDVKDKLKSNTINLEITIASVIVISVTVSVSIMLLVYYVTNINLDDFVPFT